MYFVLLIAFFVITLGCLYSVLVSKTLIDVIARWLLLAMLAGLWVLMIWFGYSFSYAFNHDRDDLTPDQLVWLVSIGLAIAMLVALFGKLMHLRQRRVDSP